MKLLFKILILSLFPLALFAGDNNYAVVNFQEILMNSKAYKDFQKQANASKTELESSLTKERNALQKSEKDLMASSETISKVEFEKRRTELQNKVQAFQTKFRDKQTAFDRNSNEAMQVIENSLRKVVAGIATEKKYDLVFVAATLGYYPPAKDISKEVLKRLDKTLSKVTLKKS